MSDLAYVCNSPEELYRDFASHLRNCGITDYEDLEEMQRECLDDSFSYRPSQIERHLSLEGTSHYSIFMYVSQEFLELPTFRAVLTMEFVKQNELAKHILYFLNSTIKTNKFLEERGFSEATFDF